MARTGITYADVQRAIDELIARGDAPSVQRIREVLGTGSFTTISDHLRHWREEREHNRDVPPPRGIPEAIVTLASDMWRQAQEAASEGLSHYREEANRQVEAAQADVAQAQREADNAVQRESALAEHLRHRELHLEEVNAELAQSRAQQEQWQRDSERAEQARKALEEEYAEREARLTAEAEARRTEALRQREDFDRQLVEEQQRNEATEGKLLALLDSLRQERAAEEKAQQKRVRQLEARLDKAGEESKRMQHELKVARDAQSQKDQDYAQLETALEGQQKAAAEAYDEAEHLQQRLRRAHDDLEQERERHRRDCDWQASLGQRLEALQHQLETLDAGVEVGSPSTSGNPRTP